MIDRLKLFLDFVGSGAWPFLVGGVICLVKERISQKEVSSYLMVLVSRKKEILFPEKKRYLDNLVYTLYTLWSSDHVQVM
jgi:hypothetical protein